VHAAPQPRSFIYRQPQPFEMLSTHGGALLQAGQSPVVLHVAATQDVPLQTAVLMHVLLPGAHGCPCAPGSAP